MADEKRIIEVRRKVISTFKLHGLILKSDASKYLVDNLISLPKQEIIDWLQKILDIVEKQQLSSTLINREVIEKAIQECSDTGDEEGEQIFTFISAFKIPRFLYNAERKKFFEVPGKKPQLFGDAKDKINLYRERYSILYQRTLHHDLFTPVAIAGSSSETTTKFELKPVEHLLSFSGNLENIIVLGMLTQLKEGKYYLEDTTGSVQLDLTNCMFHNGIYTETCFVLAEGTYDDEIFHVTALGFPPPEPAAVTRLHHGNLNFFGGPLPTCAGASEKLKILEQNYPDNMFVFLSDVWLDQPKVMMKLQIMFAGYADMAPALFVFCGNFCSTPYGGNHWNRMKELFTQLGELIADFPSLVESSRFVFVPGPRDPGCGSILPRPPIPDQVTEGLRSKVPFAIFMTNPCREDIINKICRNCINLPSSQEGMPTHFVKTILSQGHLCPLPLDVRPVYWAYDFTLQLYPIPDLIVCADKYDAYNISHLNCTCMNPGSFARNDFGFKVYWPNNKEVEDCKIND